VPFGTLARRADTPGTSTTSRETVVLALNAEAAVARSAAIVPGAGDQAPLGRGVTAMASRGERPGVVDDAVTIPLYRETIEIPRWNGVRPRWDGVCVMSSGVTGWLLAELPARWLARHHTLTLDVLRLDSAVSRLRLATIPHNADVLFDSFASAALPSLRHDIRAAGGRWFTTVDDDFWHIPPWIPMDPDDAPEQHRADLARIERGLIEADGLIVHTARMGERVQRFNQSIRVIPQALPPLDELPRPKPRPAAEPGIRIGWVGGQAHMGDLELIGPAVRELLARSPDVTFVLAGPAFPPWAVAARSSPQIELHPGWVPLPAYYRWLASLALDVFICPIADIPFNTMKPALKPLEAAGLGLPVIASAVGSYAEDLMHEDTALLVANTTKAWLAALTRLVDDAGQRAHLAARGRAWAATRTIAQTGPLWADLWGAA
jgi:glycosyltransferase involved in cell wall biosynthesis